MQVVGTEKLCPVCLQRTRRVPGGAETYFDIERATRRDCKHRQEMRAETEGWGGVEAILP